VAAAGEQPGRRSHVLTNMAPSARDRVIRQAPPDAVRAALATAPGSVEII
jgi:hypothetical protein